MENTCHEKETPDFITSADMDSYFQAFKAKKDLFWAALRAFESDYSARTREVEKTRNAMGNKLVHLQSEHDKAMKVAAAIIAKGKDSTDAEAKADNISLEIFKLERRIKALDSLAVKEDENLFAEVERTLNDLAEVAAQNRAALSSIVERVEAAQAYYETLRKRVRDIPTDTWMESENYKKIKARMERSATTN